MLHQIMDRGEIPTLDQPDLHSSVPSPNSLPLEVT